MNESFVYDYVIIGGGITGLYCARQLVEKYGSSKNIALYDDRSYFGGRLLTHYRPQYEIGGARFHDGHKLLNELIASYNMKKYELPESIDFIYKRKEQIKFYKDAHITFRTIMNNVLKLSEKVNKKALQSMTLKQFIDKASKGYSLSNKILHIFGYYSELCVMNAYDSLRSMKNDYLSNKYFVLKDGFSELTKKMFESLKLDVYMKLNCKVENVTKLESSLYQCKIFNMKKNNTFYIKSKNVIFCLKAKQLRSFDVLLPIKQHINKVYNASLLRIYAQYPKGKNGKVWFHNMNRITTNSLLRQIIPISQTEGTIMISYTDGEDINPFYENKRQRKLKSDSEIYNMIKRELNILFPECNIPKPTYFKCHLWHVGAHHWKPGVNSDKISNEILNPTNNIYVLGEAFSQKQAWIEGGLDTVNKVLDKL